MYLTANTEIDGEGERRWGVGVRGSLLVGDVGMGVGSEMVDYLT